MKNVASIIVIACLAVACGAQAPGSPDGGTAEALGTTEQAATVPSCLAANGTRYNGPPTIQQFNLATACGYVNQFRIAVDTIPNDAYSVGQVIGANSVSNLPGGTAICYEPDICHVNCYANNGSQQWYYNWTGDGSDPVQEWDYAGYVGGGYREGPLTLFKENGHTVCFPHQGCYCQ